MSVTNLLDNKLIKQEVVVFLRNSDIFSTTVRGVTTQSDTGTFAADSSHTLATTPTLVKNVRSVVVGGTTLTFGTDYTVNYETGVITFVAAQTGAYTISYDTGSTDKIFMDIPQVGIKISSYPRISVQITNVITEDNDADGSSSITSVFLSIFVYGVGTENVDDYIKSVRNVVLQHKKSFYYLRYVQIINVGPIINEPMRGDKIFTQVMDLEAPLNVEVY